MEAVCYYYYQVINANTLLSYFSPSINQVALDAERVALTAVLAFLILCTSSAVFSCIRMLLYVVG
jgi:hypothetical protein